MEHEIKTGDTVICMDAAYSFNRLQNGREYIAELVAYDKKTIVVTVNGSYHNIERFSKKGG